MHRVSHQHGGHANDLGRGQAPLNVVALADLFKGAFSKGRGPRKECQAPGQRKGIGHARVQALAAVDRVDVGGIAGEEDAALAVPGDEGAGNTFLDYIGPCCQSEICDMGMPWKSERCETRYL